MIKSIQIDIRIIGSDLTGYVAAISAADEAWESRCNTS